MNAYRPPLGETSLRPSRDKPLRPSREIETENVTFEVLYDVLLGWVHAKSAMRNRNETAKMKCLPTSLHETTFNILNETSLRPSRDTSLLPLRETPLARDYIMTKIEFIHSHPYRLPKANKENLNTQFSNGLLSFPLFSFLTLRPIMTRYFDQKIFV